MAGYIQRRPGRDGCQLMPTGSPVTETDEDFSLPDAPRGTGGPQCTCESH